MTVEEIDKHHNQIILLDDIHPAKRLFIAFCECRDNSVGRHHTWTDDKPIDQTWMSSDGKEWLFSNFAYIFLSYQLILDGALLNTDMFTEHEQFFIQKLPKIKYLMDECHIAAIKDKNAEILNLSHDILEMVKIAEEYVSFRQKNFNLLN